LLCQGTITAPSPCLIILPNTLSVTHPAYHSKGGLQGIDLNPSTRGSCSLRLYLAYRRSLCRWDCLFMVLGPGSTVFPCLLSPAPFGGGERIFADAWESGAGDMRSCRKHPEGGEPTPTPCKGLQEVGSRLETSGVGREAVDQVRLPYLVLAAQVRHQPWSVVN
jgi:hypothetical protein